MLQRFLFCRQLFPKTRNGNNFVPNRNPENTKNVCKFFCCKGSWSARSQPKIGIFFVVSMLFFYYPPFFGRFYSVAGQGDGKLLRQPHRAVVAMHTVTLSLRRNHMKALGSRIPCARRTGSFCETPLVEPCPTIWAVIWGGAKHMGEENAPENALPKIFGPLQKSFWPALSWSFVQEKQSTDT